MVGAANGSESGRYFLRLLVEPGVPAGLSDIRINQRDGDVALHLGPDVSSDRISATFAIVTAAAGPAVPP